MKAFSSEVDQQRQKLDQQKSCNSYEAPLKKQDCWIAEIGFFFPDAIRDITHFVTAKDEGLTLVTLALKLFTEVNLHIS